MAKLSRRNFLRATATAGSAAVLANCGFGEPADEAGGRALEPALLDALAEAVLPSELGAAGRERAVAGFRRWLAEYRPVTELNHGYGTGEIEYGPPDPAPGWRAQLEALDLEARRRGGSGFAELEPEARRALVRAQLARERDARLPAPAAARHVAIGLLAWFYRSPEATDLCYRAHIARQQCRPLAASPERPAGSTAPDAGPEAAATATGRPAAVPAGSSAATPAPRSAARAGRSREA